MFNNKYKLHKHNTTSKIQHKQIYIDLYGGDYNMIIFSKAS